jgi:hypothetical protein
LAQEDLERVSLRSDAEHYGDRYRADSLEIYKLYVGSADQGQEDFSGIGVAVRAKNHPVTFS